VGASGRSWAAGVDEQAIAPHKSHRIDEARMADGPSMPVAQG
jgi:hypothetical protein